MRDGVIFPEDDACVGYWIGSDGEHWTSVNEFSIPDYTFDGIKSYVEKRIPTGNFLRAVLENNLSEAVAHADAYNRRSLAEVVSVLYNYAPSTCWGSVAAVNKWLKKEEEG